MPSKNYWINRANRRMDDYILQSEETANEITKAYYVASKRIEKEMVRVVQGLGAISNDRTALKYLKNPQSKSVIRTIRKAVSTMPDGPEKDEALTLISSPAYLYRMRRLQTVIDNARKECNRLYKVELKDATAHLRNLYNDAFSHTIYDIDKGYNTLHTFSMFPASRVNTLLKSEWSGANYSERIWNSTQNLADSLKEQLLISFMTGASVSKTAREISERFQVSAYNARRLVRTESNYIANQAEHDVYKRLGVEEYQFIATLDTRTSKLCRELDGRVFNVEDGKPGINMPPMHPNCRSTTIMYDAESPIKSRAARDADGNLIKVPGNMKYADWLKKYHPELDKERESDIINLESQRPGKSKLTAVNHSYINSGEYRRKFDNATDNPKVNRALYECAKKTLIHRSGSLYEDMYWIDATTGEIVASATDNPDEEKIKYTKKIERLIKNNNNLITIHSHPRSMPPSSYDFNSNFNHKYVKGYVIGHDGTLYEYSANQSVNNKLNEMNIALLREEYSEDDTPEEIKRKDFEAQSKALEKMLASYDIQCREVK